MTTGPEALTGLDLDWDTLDGYTPLEAVIIMEALNSEGELTMVHCATNGLRTWKAIGMCVVTTDAMRDALRGEDDEDT